MANLNLPNVREGGDIRFRIGLEDNGVAVDWSGLEGIRVFLYADAQKQVSGECTIEVDAEDNTVLACLYSGDDPQFRGINSVLVRAKYQGEIKVYDKPAINIVARTADADGVLVIDDPVVPVQINVEEVSTSLLNNAIDAAINAAAEAEKAIEDVRDEETAIQAAEAARVLAEQGRVSAEQSRVAQASADHTLAGQDHTRAESDHGTASDDHTLAVSDHGVASGDHTTALGDHSLAESDHTRAEADHGVAGSDHTIAQGDHTQAGSDHSTAVADHTQAGADHTVAGQDHTQAGTDHNTAASDHTQAGLDHTQAGEDHTQALADHQVMAGYDNRLNAVEGEVDQLEAKVTGFNYNWTPGYINQYGNWAQPDGYSQYTSRKLSASEADGIQITFDDLYCIRLAYFNGNTLVSRSSIIEHSSSPYTIDTEYDVYITLMTRYNGTSYTLDEMLVHYSFSTPVGLEPRVSALEDEIVSVEEDIAELDDVIYKNIQLTWESGYINQYGSLTAQDGYSQYTTQTLTAEQASGLLVSFQSGYQVRVAYYNNGTFVSRTALISSSPYKIDTEYSCRITIMTAANNTSYTLEQMLANYQFTPTGGLVYRTSALETKVGGMESSVDDLNVSVYGIPIVWESGNINASGAIVSGTQSNYYSQIIPNAKINGIAIEVDGGYIANLAFYENGVFVSRYGWIYAVSGKVTISTQYDARIMIAIDTDDNTKTAEEVASHIHITGFEEGLVTEVSNLDARVSVLENREGVGEYIPKLIACDFDGKILHFSFDDTCWCLYDLIQNANTYTSIFDEPFFGMLKEVHDATGMVFTLNTFNEIATNTSGYYPTGFDISDVPTKFQSDFQANKGWLKFSFHAKDEDTNYNTASGAGTDYGVFVSAIYTLTGDYDCIDHVTRLGYFGGTKENCLALRDAEHGIIGFLGADDTRAYDYYLSSSQYGWLRKKGKYFDTENELFFIKTQYRTFATGEQDVENNPCFQKVTEFFAHEYEAHNGASWDLTSMKNNILSLATWATGLGYKFYYPENIYN